MYKNALPMLFLISFGNCMSIQSDPDFPPEPEEYDLGVFSLLDQGNGTEVECSTIDSYGGISIQNGLTDPRRRWTRFSVYLDPTFNAQERAVVSNAMNTLSRAVPCLPFGLYQPGQRPSGDYVHVKRLDGCWSRLGRMGGAQDMSLGRNCVTTGTVMHEMIHALGFTHEQNRPDRDRYVTIMWQNIQRGAESQFRLASDTSTYNAPYNQQSIMHYHATAFSVNRQPTIVARNGRPVGSNGQLQQTDIDKLRRMYRC